jgi:ligand-binding SRPBCC domain-containing protein
MPAHVLQREQRVDRPREEVFAFFADAHNLEAMTPPLLRFEVLTPRPIELAAGVQISYRLRIHGVPVGWLTEIREWAPPDRFVDVQLRGPYSVWEHTHEFEALAGGGTAIRDTVRYRPMLWPVGELALPLVRRDLRAIFDFRRDAVTRLLGAAPRSGALDRGPGSDSDLSTS